MFPPPSPRLCGVSSRPAIGSVPNRWRRGFERTLFRSDAQTRHCDFRVVSEAKPINALSGFEFSGCHQRAFVVTRDDSSVDDALNLLPFDGESDLLRNGLSHSRGLVHGRVRLSLEAVHLEGAGTKAAYDESPVAISRTVEVTLAVGSHVVARDENAVRMWMAVQVHVLGLGKGRFHSVIARGLVGGIPIGHSRTRGDPDGVAL